MHQVRQKMTLRNVKNMSHTSCLVPKKTRKYEILSAYSLLRADLVRKWDSLVRFVLYRYLKGLSRY